MRLDRVALRSFLSHDDTDWQPDGARLVSVVGRNGAGKSALTVDALLYALFDDARGRTDDLVSLGGTAMSARVELLFDGQRYAIERGRTTRAGGKSYLELAIRDGEAWRPLTGDTIKDTETRIRELFRMDARAFETAVVLGQGRAMAFAESTAAERKRILGQILDLEVYARAETRCREQGRELEGRTGEQTEQIRRLADAFEGLEPSRDLVKARRLGIHEIAKDQTAAATERDRIQTRLTELAGEIAAGAAAEADVTRLEAERAGLAERYRREQKTIADATAAADAARVSIAAAGDVDQAIEDLPTMRLEVESLEQVEADDRRLGIEARDKRDGIAALERPYEQARAAWLARYEAAVNTADELEDHGRAGTSVCQACGQPIGQDAALKQLKAARARVKELAATEPKRPLAIDREKVALARIDERLRELDWDPGILAEARRQLAELERTAARGEAIAIAGVNLEAAEEARAGAVAELAKIQAAGEMVAQQLVAAAPKVAGLEPRRAEQSLMQELLTTQGATISRLERDRREVERQLAAAEADVARLDELVAEREALTVTRDAGTAELVILQQLVQAFGVTGIPARIIESIVPELEGYANALLGELRPGMDLAIRAQRAKKDGKGLIEALDLVVRDAAGERPLAMFSGGERMSVSLAIAVAMSRLVARRAGAAIRTLVLDEPDGLDSDARRSLGQELRVLAHKGELDRLILVSHHEDLAEFGDAVYRVSKNGAGSHVELVS